MIQIAARRSDIRIHPDSLCNWLVSAKKLVDGDLDRLLASSAASDMVQDLRSVCFPGRRVRPALCITLARDAAEHLKPEYLALELVHCASIVVDDFLDDDDGRRDMGNTCGRSGPASILGSHLLMALVFTDLGLNRDRADRLLTSYNRMCRAEYADIFCIVPRSSWLRHYHTLVLDKTMPLFELAFEWGLAARSGMDASIARQLGRMFGSIFQMSNDIFDCSAKGRSQRNQLKHQYPLSLTLPLAIHLDAGNCKFSTTIASRRRPILSRDDLDELGEDILADGSHQLAIRILHRYVDHFGSMLRARLPGDWPWLSTFISQLSDCSAWTRDYELLREPGGQK